jgi:hypothetical protein
VHGATPTTLADAPSSKTIREPCNLSLNFSEAQKPRWQTTATAKHLSRKRILTVNRVRTACMPRLVDIVSISVVLLGER